MDNLGKRPPRALQSYGVAGLLGEECRIFYDSVYSTRHAGRLADLLSARLRDTGPDELRLRATLLYALFEGHRAMLASNPPKEPGALAEGKLSEPLVVECGVDGEKIAVGVNFNFAEGTALPDLGALAKRVAAGKPEGAFEETLAGLHRSAHQLVLRMQPSARRFEAVALLGLPGKVDAAALARTRPIETVLFEQDPPSPPKSAYVELGDLDYPGLLRDDAPGKNKQPFRAGEALAAAAAEAAQPARAKVTGARAEAETERAVAGSKTADAAASVKTGEVVDDRSKVDGAGSDDASLARVKGDGKGVDAELVRVVSGGGQGAETASRGAAAAKGETGAIASGDAHSASDDYLRAQQKIAELTRRIAELEVAAAGAQGGALTVISGGAQLPVPIEAGGAQAPGASMLSNLLRRIWPFNRGKGGEAAAVATAAGAEAVAAEGIEPGADAAAAGGEAGGETGADGTAAASKPVQGAINLEAVAKSLMAEIQVGSFEKAISKAQRETVEMKARVKDNKVRQWMDGLMGELVGEKGRLHELAKKLNVSIRQKELEFRNKEQALSEDVRRRDEQIRQKDYAIQRSRDQITQLATALERMKKGSASAGDDAAYQQKFHHVSKMLTSAKDENHSLTKRVEELKKQLALAKTLGKNQGPSFQDMNALQDRYEKTMRQMEEFKRQTQQLTEKLAESRAKGGAAGMGASGDENRKRLEAAMKMLAQGKKDQEKLSTKVSEMQRDEVKLRADLAKAQAETRRLRAMLGGAAPGGEGSGGTSGKPPKSAA